MKSNKTLLKKWAAGVFSLWLSVGVWADTITLNAPSSGPFAAITKFFQSIVDFLGGAGSMFVVFLSIVAGIGLWMVMPKQAGTALGFIFRAAVGAVVLFGAGTFVTWLQSFAGG